MKATIILLFVIAVGNFFAQSLDKNKKYFVSGIGFWNVENLYDTLNDQWKNDEDFTASGIYAWTGSRYRTKIEHLAEVIEKMGKEMTPDGLSILGLCETENKSVVLDLVNAPLLKNRNYKVVHIEGPDARGVDPSFIYNPTYFSYLKSVAYHVTLVQDSSFKTRDILVVSGLLGGEPLTILVNHWPSRRGGETQSSSNRNAAAKVVRRITDSVAKANKNSKIIVMGDFNDDPVNESIKVHIGTYNDPIKKNENVFYNPMEKLFENGIGSLAWQDSWNLFDQILLNRPWLNDNDNSWQFHSVKVFNKTFLTNDYGKYKGYPARTFSGNVYTGGYSDHFPVYIMVTKGIAN